MAVILFYKRKSMSLPPGDFPTIFLQSPAKNRIIHICVPEIKTYEGKRKMPDTEGPDKKEPRRREFMREKIVKPPLTRRQIAARAAVFLLAAAAFGAVSALSFTAVRSWSKDRWEDSSRGESAAIEFNRDDPEAQPEESGSVQESGGLEETVPVDEAVKAYMETYEFTSEDLKSMYDSVRAVEQQADRGIVTVHSGMQQTDLFGNPIETSGYCAGAVIARTSSSYIILTRSSAVSQADSICVEFFDGTEAPASVLQNDSVTGMAVVLADAAAVDSELRGEIQVIPLGNSYSVKAGDMVIGVGAPAGMVHSSVYGAITYVARNVPVTDGVSRILFTDLTSSGDAGTFILNLNGEMIGWTDNSLKGENSIVSESVMSISDYKGILEKMTNGAETAYFGIKGQEVSETMQAEGIPKGVYITDAVSGGPAYEAGLQNGDIIVQFDGRDVATLKELSTQIASFQLGNAAAVTVMRKGRDGYTSLEYQVTVRGR